MATYYRYKRPITNSGAIPHETKTFTGSDGETTRTEVFGDTKEAVLAFQNPTETSNIYDFSEFVAELQLVHNDVDGEDAGRSKQTGKMKRVYITNKHTLNIKMVNKLPQSVAKNLFSCIESTTDRQHLYVWFQSPCGDKVVRKDVYCSTINYGAQRYDRNENKCFYDGMNFNLIEM